MSRTLSIALSFLKACAVLCQWSTIHSNRKKMEGLIPGSLQKSLFMANMFLRKEF